MRLCTLALAVAAIGVAAPASARQSTEADAPQVGSMAPDFTLQAATRYGVLGEAVKLSDFRGKTVVLAFFPAARTQGCTIQMRAYRDQYAEVFNGGKDVVVIGISTDNVAALHSWASDEDFPVLFASDTPMNVASQYGAVRNDTRTNRNLYVIDPEGRVAYRALPFREVDPTSYEELAEVVRGLSSHQN